MEWFSLDLFVTMENIYASSFGCLAGRFCPVLTSKIVEALAAISFFLIPVLAAYIRIYTRVS